MSENLLSKFCFRHESLGNVYKQCYGKTLRQGSLPLLDLVKHLCKVLQELEKIIDKLEK